MEITRTSQLTGVTRTIDLPITQAQIDAHHNGGYIQVVMRNLTAGQREFYMTGVTDEEWDKAFKEPEEYGTDGPDADGY